MNVYLLFTTFAYRSDDMNLIGMFNTEEEAMSFAELVKKDLGERIPFVVAQEVSPEWSDKAKSDYVMALLTSAGMKDMWLEPFRPKPKSHLTLIKGGKG